MARMRVDRLNPEGQLMLDASRAWPQDIGALAMLDGTVLFDEDGRFRIETVRAAVASRLHLVPRFRQVLRSPRPGRGAPYWADATAFELSRHVCELPLQAPAGEAELMEAVERLRATRFERRHPLWMMWLITGMPDRRVALFVKIHHTIADGLAAMTIMASFLDHEADAAHPPARPWHPRPAPRPSDLVADNLQRRVGGLVEAIAPAARPWRIVRSAREMWPAVRELIAEQPGDSTSLDRIVGDGRRLALVRGEHRTTRRIGRAFGASVNDVLLSVTTAGLRELLLTRGEPADGVTMRIYVPVSLRRRLRGPQQGTNIAQMAVPLSLSAANPVDRLRRIAAETQRRKARLRPPLGKVFRGRLATRLLLKAVVAQRVNATSASIPGPFRPAYLAGARVLEIYPVIPLLGNEPLGVGAITYADTWNIGIAADRETVPDLEVLAGAMRAELAALEAAAARARPEQRRNGGSQVPSGRQLLPESPVGALVQPYHAQRARAATIRAQPSRHR